MCFMELKRVTRSQQNNRGIKMFEFVLNKIKNRKWLNLCLLMGVALFISLFVCHPMFEKGAGNQILNTLFTKQAQKNNEFPAMMSRVGSYEIKDYKNSQSVLDKLSEYEKKWMQYVNIDSICSQKYLMLAGGKADTDLGGINDYFEIGYLTQLEEFSEIVKSVNENEQGNITNKDKPVENAEKIYECTISEKTMDRYGLVVGEKLYLQVNDGKNKKEIPFMISNVCREKDINDPYWAQTLADIGDTIFVSQDIFDDMVQYFSDDAINYSDYLMLDYRQINTENASEYSSYISQFRKADELYSDNLAETFDTFFVQQKMVKLMLWALELPCLVLLLLFIRMISTQILSLEENDILVLRSRGATKVQVLLLYLEQSSIVSAAGCIVGIIMGYIMCKVAASTDGFLSFTSKNISSYKFVWQMLLYALVAGIIMVAFMTIPVWRKSVNAIAERNSSRYISMKKPLWEKFFLDIILMIVSVYLLYNYNKQKDTLAISVLESKSMDPVMILDNSLFIFAAALLCVRLIGLLILLVNKLIKKHFSPAMYASFLQLKRTRYKQGFLGVFLIMTVASGIFDANMARTMNSNMEQRIMYNVGADVTSKESFGLRIVRKNDGTVNWMYYESDFGKYQSLKNEGICDSVTRVIEDDNIDISANGNLVTKASLMAIHTREFGQTAKMQEGLNKKHWFYDLNALADEPDGVIISSNLANALKVKVGDSLNYSRRAPEETGKEGVYHSENAKVCAIVETFPGYERYYYDKDESGKVTEQERYLIVGNYATVVEKFGMTPYSVWMKLAEGKTASDVEAYLSKENSIDDVKNTRDVKLQIENTQELIYANKNSAIVQVTNGMFTLSFILSLIVCSVGFLLYWIMELKQRELQFGIYRAMGMRMKEIKTMLINEQIFLSILPLLSGAGIGMAATALFVRLISIVYLPEKHNIGITVYIYLTDMLELAAVQLVAVAICYVVISRLLKRMKIAQALRLGEDS